jgi:hypothetical protein
MRLAPCLFQRLFDLAQRMSSASQAITYPRSTKLWQPVLSPSILTTHEPSAGSAVDAYAPLKGIGVGMGTYGASVLNMVNPMAGCSQSESFARCLLSLRFMCFS